jgi:hypothetical protein
MAALAALGAAFNLMHTLSDKEREIGVVPGVDRQVCGVI